MLKYGHYRIINLLLLVNIDRTFGLQVIVDL